MRQPESGQANRVITISIVVWIRKVRIPKIVLGQMALQIARVVKDPNNIDHGFASASVDQKMSRLPDYAKVTSGPITAEG